MQLSNKYPRVNNHNYSSLFIFLLIVLFVAVKSCEETNNIRVDDAEEHDDKKIIDDNDGCELIICYITPNRGYLGSTNQITDTSLKLYRSDSSKQQLFSHHFITESIT